VAKEDSSVDRILAVMREEHPDLTDEEWQTLAEGIIEMGNIVYQRTQEGKIFVQDDPTRSH
jgi:hypothetical protein